MTLADTRVASDPVRFFTVMSTIFGLIWVLANPAWLGFDERTHMARAWGLAGGHIVTQADLGAPDGTTADGDLVPAELFDDRATYVEAVQGTGLDNLYAGYRDLLASRPGADTRYEDTRPAMAAPVLAYLPSAVPMVAARAFDLPLLAALWLARLANLAVYIGVVRWAVRRAVSHRWLLVAAALLPLNLYVAASLSPDGIVIAAVAVVAALLTRVAAREALSRTDVIVAAVVFAGVKPPYVAAAALLPLMALLSHRSDRSILRASIVVAAVAGCAGAAWRVFAAPSYEPVSVFLEGDPFRSDPDRQVDAVFDDLGRFVGSVMHSSVLDLPIFLARWMFGFGPFELASTAVGVVTFAIFAMGAYAAHGRQTGGVPLGRAPRVVVTLGVLGLWAALLAATFLYFTNGLPDSFEVPARYDARPSSCWRSWCWGGGAPRRWRPVCRPGSVRRSWSAACR